MRVEVVQECFNGNAEVSIQFHQPCYLAHPYRRSTVGRVVGGVGSHVLNQFVVCHFSPGNLMYFFDSASFYAVSQLSDGPVSRQTLCVQTESMFQ